jgi:hypothetical protein
MAGSADNAARFFMRPATVLITAALMIVFGLGAAYFLVGGGAREPIAESPDSRAVPPRDSPSNAAPLAEAGQIATPARSRQLALELERALAASDLQQRETAFNILLPELLQADSARVVGILGRQEPGAVREALRDEVARQWIRLNRDAAIEWIGSLDQAERRSSATVAMRTLAASDPAQAIQVADQFGVGRDDGSLEYIVQIWATEDPDAAMRWVDRQPPGDPRTVQLKARIEEVRLQQPGKSQ